MALLRSSGKCREMGDSSCYGGQDPGLNQTKAPAILSVLVPHQLSYLFSPLPPSSRNQLTKKHTSFTSCSVEISASPAPDNEHSTMIRGSAQDLTLVYPAAIIRSLSLRSTLKIREAEFSLKERASTSGRNAFVAGWSEGRRNDERRH